MMKTTFEKAYPNISTWVKHYGWIEMGKSDTRDSLLRALNREGLVWESRGSGHDLNEALSQLEKALETDITDYA